METSLLEEVPGVLLFYELMICFEVHFDTVDVHTGACTVVEMMQPPTLYVSKEPFLF